MRGKTFWSCYARKSHWSERDETCCLVDSFSLILSWVHLDLCWISPLCCSSRILNTFLRKRVCVEWGIFIAAWEKKPSRFYYANIDIRAAREIPFPLLPRRSWYVVDIYIMKWPAGCHHIPSSTLFASILSCSIYSAEWLLRLTRAQSQQVLQNPRGISHSLSLWFSLFYLYSL